MRVCVRETSRGRGRSPINLLTRIRLFALWGLLPLATIVYGQQTSGPAPSGAASTSELSTAQTPPGTTVSKSPGRSAENVEDPFDREWSIELFYWYGISHPDLKGGAAAPDYETLDYPGRSDPTIPGAQASLRLTPNDYIRVSYFRMTGQGTTVSTQALDLFGTNIPSNEYLAAKYRLNAFKFSFEDLFYPYPHSGAKLSYKTLWEVQMAKVDTRVDAPFDTSTTSGYTTFPSATGERYVILPALGMAVRYVLSKNIHLELRSSGFGIPHHQDLVDSQASAGTWLGRTEISLGAKFYHWKTSPQNAEYFAGTIIGGFVGLRWGAPK